MAKIFCLLLLLELLAVASPARAQTQILFSKDGTKVTLLMIAVSKNPDAVSLYDAMNVPPEEMNGKLTKKILFKDADGVQAFDIVCAFSKIVADTGSCVSVFHHSRDVVMNPSGNSVSYTAHGDQAQQFASLFVKNPGTTEIYHNGDHHFVIHAEPNADHPDTVTAEYR